jgi:hypothetical protein
MLQQVFRFAAVVIVIVLLTGCNLPAAITPAPPTATTAPPASTPAPTAGAARYVNEEGRFSLALPEGWSALGPLAINADPDRPYNLYVLGVDPSSSGGPGPSKIALLDPSQWTPDTFAQAQCTTCPDQPFEDTTLGGKPARRTQVGGDGVPFMVTWYFVENNGKLIALDIHNPDTMEPLEDTIQSIQFE